MMPENEPAKFEDGPDKEIEKIPEKATDMEIAFFLAEHIDNPCEAEVGEDEKANIRAFYLQEARLQLPKMTNEPARRFLELKIKRYEK